MSWRDEGCADYCVLYADHEGPCMDLWDAIAEGQEA